MNPYASSYVGAPPCTTPSSTVNGFGDLVISSTPGATPRPHPLHLVSFAPVQVSQGDFIHTFNPSAPAQQNSVNNVLNLAPGSAVLVVQGNSERSIYVLAQGPGIRLEDAEQGYPLKIRNFLDFTHGAAARPSTAAQIEEMDQAARGASALATGDFASAITHYTQAIAINPSAVDYYVKRSTAFTRLSPPDHTASYNDAEIAVSLAAKRAKRELIGQSQLRRAIALFGLERYADAKQCLEWVKKFNEKEKSLGIWGIKVASKLKGLDEDDQRAVVSVKEIPDVETPSSAASTQPAKPAEKEEDAKISDSNGGVDPGKNMNSSNGVKEATKDAVTTSAPGGVQTPASKIRHEWYQTNHSVIITLYCKGIPKDKATIEIKQNSLEVSFPLPTGSDYQFSLDPLFSDIDRMKSYYKIMSTKAEFTLIKSTPGRKWASIEGTGPAGIDNAGTNLDDPSHEAAKRAALADKTVDTAPAYPTSSKSGPKDWDKVAADLSKRPKKDPKEGEEDATEEPGIDDEDGDPTTNFFKMLYNGADDDTKRAMMKSYQESNGTALSTNWAEVGKGPVETSPPDGMEAKKWGQ